MAPRLLLHDIFCFPLYIFPLFIIIGWLIFYLILKILNCFNAVSEDSKQAKKAFEQQKQQTLQHLQNLTPLPIDIVNVIVNQYLFDNTDKLRIYFALNRKLEFKSKIILSFMLVYSIIGVALYVVCFGIIAYELHLYSQESTNHSSWKGFQAWIVTILVCHPFWKMVNWTTSIYTVIKGLELKGIDDVRDVKDGIYWFYVLTPYAIIILGFAIPVFFTMFIPTLIVFIPLLVGLFCVGWCFGGIYAYLIQLNKDWSRCILDSLGSILNRIVDKCIRKMGEWGFDDYEEEIAGLSLIYLAVYILAVFMIPMIWCFYNGDSWVDSFLYGLTLGYCPNITIDITNWKSVIFFVTWSLF